MVELSATADEATNSICGPQAMPQWHAGDEVIWMSALRSTRFRWQISGGKLISHSHQ